MYLSAKFGVNIPTRTHISRGGADSAPPRGFMGAFYAVAVRVDKRVTTISLALSSQLLPLLNIEFSDDGGGNSNNNNYDGAPKLIIGNDQIDSNPNDGTNPNSDDNNVCDNDNSDVDDRESNSILIEVDPLPSALPSAPPPPSLLPATSLSLTVQTEFVYYLELDADAFGDPRAEVEPYFNSVVDKLAWLLLDPDCILDRKAHLGLRSRLRKRKAGGGRGGGKGGAREGGEVVRGGIKSVGGTVVAAEKERDETGTVEEEMLSAVEGTLEEEGSLEEEEEETLVVEVGPRLSFSSPFSTNAVGICRAAGLGKVKRLERAVRYSN